MLYLHRSNQVQNANGRGATNTPDRSDRTQHVRGVEMALRFKACAVPDCNNNAALKGCARGFCAKHYRRWKLYGDPLGLAPRAPGKIETWIQSVALPYASDDCLIWPFHRNARGYATYTTNGRPHIASRIICELAHGRAPANGMVAAHYCNNGHLGCVSPNHLRWATASENEIDKVANGTSNRGERHGMAKLTEADVLQIRQLAGSATYVEIAEEFGVSAWTVGDIVRRKLWGWLP